MLDLLFVYGTLRSTFDNPWARMLRSEARTVGVSAARGSLFRAGEFTAWWPRPAGEVPGELYRLADPVKTLSALDEYEGPEFPRVVTTLLTGEEAWIYGLASEPAPELQIAL